MHYDRASRTLTFGSDEEAGQFHDELSALLRHAMIEATRTVQDAEQAKAISREVFKECATVTRALNAFRKELPRHSNRG